MASIQIGGLSDRVYRELKARAAANGRTTASEARVILETALDLDPEPPTEAEKEAVAKDRAREKLRKAMIKWASR